MHLKQINSSRLGSIATEVALNRKTETRADGLASSIQASSLSTTCGGPQADVSSVSGLRYPSGSIISYSRILTLL